MKLILNFFFLTLALVSYTQLPNNFMAVYKITSKQLPNYGLQIQSPNKPTILSIYSNNYTSYSYLNITEQPFNIYSNLGTNRMNIRFKDSSYYYDVKGNSNNKYSYEKFDTDYLSSYTISVLDTIYKNWHCKKITGMYKNGEKVILLTTNELPTVIGCKIFTNISECIVHFEVATSIVSLEKFVHIQNQLQFNYVIPDYKSIEYYPSKFKVWVRSKPFRILEDKKIEFLKVLNINSTLLYKSSDSLLQKKTLLIIGAGLDDNRTFEKNMEAIDELNEIHETAKKLLKNYNFQIWSFTTEILEKFNTTNYPFAKYANDNDFDFIPNAKEWLLTNELNVFPFAILLHENKSIISIINPLEITESISEELKKVIKKEVSKR